MAQSKKPTLLYGGRRPPGYLPAHNHVLHTAAYTHGVHGFRRFWIPPQWVRSRGWSRCPCGWRGHDPKWQVHYAGPEHVRWWKEQIAQRGSLEAVYKYIVALVRRSDLRHHQRWERERAAAKASN